jgi:YD repeat-containing protein
MRHGIGLVVCLGACLVACTSPSEKKLPSASITPHLDVAATDAACGDDIMLYGAATPDLSYTYDYDSAGRMFHATGVYAAGGANDDVTYTYDNLDRMTGMVETRGWGDTRYEIAADYDTLGELVDYTWSASSPTYNDSWRYAYSAFNQWGEPTREVITQQGQPDYGYSLAFDPDGRIISATEDNGPTTSYGYDDTGLVLTIDTNAGAWHGEVAYDDQFRELSETWGGSDPSAIATEQTYNWDSGRLLGATYRQSANNDPAGLTLVETDTLRYGCSSARKAGTGRFRPAHPIARR